MQNNSKVTIMVSIIKETHQPYYLLDDIRQAAQSGNFRYEGRKVNTDIRNQRGC